MYRRSLIVHVLRRCKHCNARVTWFRTVTWFSEVTRINIRNLCRYARRGETISWLMRDFDDLDEGDAYEGWKTCLLLMRSMSMYM